MTPAGRTSEVKFHIRDFKQDNTRLLKVAPGFKNHEAALRAFFDRELPRNLETFCNNLKMKNIKFINERRLCGRYLSH